MCVCVCDRETEIDRQSQRKTDGQRGRNSKSETGGTKRQGEIDKYQRRDREIPRKMERERERERKR